MYPVAASDSRIKFHLNDGDYFNINQTGIKANGARIKNGGKRLYPINSLTLLNNSCGSNGFSMQASAPFFLIFPGRVGGRR